MEPKLYTTKVLGHNQVQKKATISSKVKDIQPGDYVLYCKSDLGGIYNKKIRAARVLKGNNQKLITIDLYSEIEKGDTIFYKKLTPVMLE